jgi:hypothetical protein
MTNVQGLVGRQAELESLDEFLVRAAAGQSAIFLEGEAGIGKTSLWNEGVDRARARGLPRPLDPPWRNGGPVRVPAGLTESISRFLSRVDLGRSGLVRPLRPGS